MSELSEPKTLEEDGGFVLEAEMLQRDVDVREGHRKRA